QQRQERQHEAAHRRQRAAADVRRQRKTLQADKDDDQVGGQKAEFRRRFRQRPGQVVQQPAQNRQDDQLSQKARLHQHLLQQIAQHLEGQLHWIEPQPALGVEQHVAQARRRQPPPDVVVQPGQQLVQRTRIQQSQLLLHRFPQQPVAFGLRRRSRPGAVPRPQDQHPDEKQNPAAGHANPLLSPSR